MLGRGEAWVDGALDGLVVAFALWTVAYQVALVGEWSLWGPTAAWVAVTLVLVLVGARVRGAEVALPTPPPVHRLPRTVTAAAVALLGGAAWAAGRLTDGDLGVVLAVVLALLVLADGVVRCVRRPADPGAPADVDPERRPRDLVVVVLAGLALAVLASLLRRPDADDAFYVNRSAWVADRGFAPVRDTMFGPETYPSTYGDGLLFPSVEALLGALAHLVGVRAGTLVYVGLPPLLAFLVALVTWRLVRAWVPRRRLAVFLVALAAPVAVGASSILGNYSVGRIWQGKVIAFAVLLPLVWVHLTEAADGDPRQRRRAVLLLLAGGVAFAGLTSGAPLLGPSMALGALLAAALLRSSGLALGALALLVGPLAAGASVVLRDGGTETSDIVALPTGAAFAVALGNHVVLVAVGLLALAVAARQLPPTPALLASWAAIGSLVALLPFVAPLVDDVTGAGPIAWRLATLTPLAVLIGVLLVDVLPDLVLPSRVPGRAWVGAATGVTVLALAGTPLWLDPLDEPGWRLPPGSLRSADRVLALPSGPGTVLMPEPESVALAVSTTDRFATVPRAAYLSALEEDQEQRQARYELYRWANHGEALSPTGLVRRLERLDVAVACVPSTSDAATRTLPEVAAGVTEVVEVGRLSCAARPGSTWTR